MSVASATVAIGGSIPRKAWLNGQLAAAPTWRSANEAIARVSNEGTVTGIAAGTTTLTATQGQATASAEITVVELKFKQLVVGGRSACAQTDAGSWYCWGDNGVGTLGRLAGTAEVCQSQRRECSTTPRIPNALPSFQDMAISGGGLTCGLTTQGETLCWGRNDNRQYFGAPTEMCEIYSGRDDVANDSFVCSRTPAPIPSQIRFSDIVAGDVACGLVAEGTAHCWGAAGLSGQLGVSATGTCDGIPCIPAPGPAVPTLKFRQISAGSGATCGVTTTNAGYCWGWNHIGQRGADVPEGQTPNAVSGGHSFAQISIFRDHTCGVTVAGDGYCWGSNSVGQLGRPVSELSAAFTPQLVSGGLKFLSITPGLVSTCGLATDGAAYCWGDNAAGQLGDGTNQSRSLPARVTGGLRFTQVSSGRHFTCGLTVDRNAYCWGGNTFGELGYGDSGTALSAAYFSPKPVGVGGLP